MEWKMKKGQTSMTLQGLVTVGVAFVVVGIVLGMGGLINNKIVDTMTSGGTYENETLSSLTTTVNQSVSLAGSCDFVLGSTIIVTNQSDGYNFNSANYTTTTAGVIGWLGDAQIGTVAGNGLNITYSYSHGNDSAASTMCNSTASLAELSSWLPTIAIIIAAAIIIGIVVTYFYVRST